MNTPSTLPQPTRSVPRRRWGIGVLLGAGILVSYFDRVSLSVAAPQLQAEFGFDQAQLGLLFSGFFWTYAILQIPVGVVLDRLGVKTIGRLGALLWTIGCALTAFCGGFTSLFAARAILGCSEAPSFPASSKATGYWFPRGERAMATALFDAAAKFSNVLGVPLVAFAVVRWGWRWGFGVTALFSFLYFLAFTWLYRDPSDDRRLTSLELEYIRKGGGVPEGPSHTKAIGMLGYLLTQKKVWGLTLGFAAYGYSFYLFLTWLPGYLVHTMHMSILGSAGYSTIPWGVATVTDLLVGGWLIDHLLARGHDETAVRKTVLVSGMILGLAVVGATQTSDPAWAITWIAIALGGLAAAAPVGWSLPSLVAPKGGVATIASIMNFANNMMGVAAPLLTGFIIEKTHSFTYAFLAAGVILLGGILSFVLLLGKIEPIPDATEPAAA